MEPSYSLSRSQEFLPRLATAPPLVNYMEKLFFLSKIIISVKIQVIWGSFPAILAISQNYNTDLQKVI